MFFVAGATGQTGKVVAEELLKAGQKVRVLVRDAAKAAGLAARGAEVLTGNLEDHAALAAALEGVKGAYLLMPPDNAATDFLASRRALVDQYAQALERTKLPQLVFLSSIGANLPSGTGPIASGYYAEGRLTPLVENVTWIRASYFLENWGASIAGVAGEGVLHQFLNPALEHEMVSVQDIGRLAADLLLRGESGRKVVNLSGPRPYRVSDIAAAFSAASGKAVTVQTHPVEAVVPVFTSIGLGADLARLYAEMYQNWNDGKIAMEHEGIPLVRGTVTPEQVFAPWFAKE